MLGIEGIRINEIPGIFVGIQNRLHVLALVAGVKTRHLFHHDPLGLESLDYSDEVVEQSAPRPRKSRPLTGNAQVLARRPTSYDIDLTQRIEVPLSPHTYVPEVWHTGKAVLQNATGERLDFGMSH